MCRPFGAAHFRLTINLMGILRTFGWFVGNGLDRSVLPCQKHNATRKPRAVRRDFMRCARPDVRRGQDTRPTNVPETDFFYKLRDAYMRPLQTCRKR